METVNQPHHWKRYAKTVVYLKPFGSFINIQRCVIFHGSKTITSVVLAVGDELNQQVMHIDPQNKQVTASLQRDDHVHAQSSQCEIMGRTEDGEEMNGQGQRPPRHSAKGL